MLVRTLHLSIAALALLCCCVANAAERNPRDMLLTTTGLPSISDEEKALVEVASAKGAPAVVLVNAEQDDWTVRGALTVKRTVIFRRVKILTAAGVQDYGSYKVERFGELHLEQVDARTVLPDGTVVDAAKNVNVGLSEQGYRVVSVSFPQVQVGAILDLQVSLWTETLPPYTRYWPIQEALPVRESRLVWIPPAGVLFLTAFRNLAAPTAMSQTPVENKKPTGPRTRPAYIWSFRDIEPAPQEPYEPPIEDVEPMLLVVPLVVPNAAPTAYASKTWKSFATDLDRVLWNWIQDRKGETRRTATRLTANMTTAEQKLGAVRDYLSRNFRVTSRDSAPHRGSPDEALAKGTGTSADAAMLAVAMLRSVDVTAAPAVYRRGVTGAQQPPALIFDMFDDMLVRVVAEKGPVYWSPASDLPPGVLPPKARGTLVMPIGTGAAGPEAIPPLKPEDNQWEAVTSARVDATGAIEAETTQTFTPIAAEPWRRTLRAQGETTRKDTVRDWLRRRVSGAEITSLEISNLENPDANLLFKIAWRAEGFGTVAGDRLLVPAVIFQRQAAEDWSADQRRSDIDLGDPGRGEEVLNLAVPEGAGEATLPLAVHIEHPDIGSYAMEYSKQPDQIVARRELRLDATNFPAGAWRAVRGWFKTIAATDDARIMVKLTP